MTFRAHFLLVAVVLGLPQYSNGEFEPMAVTPSILTVGGGLSIARIVGDDS